MDVDTPPSALHWFRDDLRLADNPALDHAARSADRLLAVVIDEEYEDPAIRPLGAAARWWREHSLARLESSLADHAVQLVRLTGDPRTLIPDLVQRINATHVTWSRRYNPPLCAIDAVLKTTLTTAGIAVHSAAGHLLTEPWDVRTTTGGAYKVYTPFARAARTYIAPPSPLPVPELPPSQLSPSALQGLPHSTPHEEPHWAAETLARHCCPGEAAAHTALEEFCDRVEDYADQRDVPAVSATSNLSAHLRFGEISIGTAWAATSNDRFQSQLLWRDFAWHRLYHRGQLHLSPIDERFAHFPYRHDPEDLTAWQRGETGIGIVDAGMQELWQTGRMHNRIRMLTGSVLTKNLGIDWRAGEAWFWDTLVDADPAINPFSWQWVAGCGDDAAPYFRIFNPELQAKKFDASGTYTRRWRPTTSPSEPIVDLAETRQWALAAFKDISTLPRLRGQD